MAQAEKLMHASSYVYHVESVGALAEKLAEITTGALQKSFFGNGAEAIEGAFRLAKRYSGKDELVALEPSLHGRSCATLSVTGGSGRKKGGIIVPPDGYFKRVKEILDDEGVLFIADEVQRGFGPAGKMFAIEHFGVEPDIMCMARGIADGWPLSAFIADPKTKAYGTAAGAFVRQYCLEHNLLIGVGGNFGSVLRIQPPLVISDAQLDTVFATVADGIAAYASMS